MKSAEIKRRWNWLSEQMQKHNFKHIGGHGDLASYERNWETIATWQIDRLTASKMWIANLIYQEMRKQGLIDEPYER